MSPTSTSFAVVSYLPLDRPDLLASVVARAVGVTLAVARRAIPRRPGLPAARRLDADRPAAGIEAKVP